MEIFYWILFILSILGLIIATIAVIVEIDMEESWWIFLFPVGFIITSFVYMSSREIFPTSTSTMIWKIGNAIFFITFLFVLFSFRKSIRKDYKPQIISIPIFISIFFGVVPFVLKMNLHDSDTLSYLNEFNNSYPKIVFSFWVPLLFILIISIIVYRIFSSSSKREQQRFIRYVLDRLSNKETRYRDEYELENERIRYREFDSKYYRSMNEEMRYLFEKNMKMFEELNYKQKDYLEHYVNKILVNTSGTSKSQSIDSKSLVSINESINELKKELQDIKLKDDNLSISQYNNSNNQLFIRELYHFLITPLSQIETKTIIFDENYNEISKDEKKFKKTLSTIKTSVDICKSVLAAYRELAFVTSSSDWSPESLKRSIIAAAHLYQESLEKQVEFIVDLEDEFSAYTNNYLLAILLPLLENAIKASPPSAKISLINKRSDSEIVLVIQNESINTPSVKQLNTPGYSSKRNHKGTGLQIVRHLVKEQNKGSIEFDVDGVNITTTVKLPNRKTNE